MIAARFDTLTAAAEGCDVLVASGVTRFAARSAAGKPGVRYMFTGMSS